MRIENAADVAGLRIPLQEQLFHVGGECSTTTVFKQFRRKLFGSAARLLHLLKSGHQNAKPTRQSRTGARRRRE